MSDAGRALMRFGIGAGVVVIGGSLLLYGCAGDTATLPVSAGTGPNPTLPPPHHTLLPTVKIAPVVGWAEGAGPVPAAG